MVYQVPIQLLQLLKEKIAEIEHKPKEEFEPKIAALTDWRAAHTALCEEKAPEVNLLLDRTIEDWFGLELRRLNAIREQNLETVSIAAIQALKRGYTGLFSAIDATLSWNPELKYSIEGVINRASLRAMLIDPEVSVKEKEDIMNRWEEFM